MRVSERAGVMRIKCDRKGGKVEATETYKLPAWQDAPAPNFTSRPMIESMDGLTCPPQNARLHGTRYEIAKVKAELSRFKQLI